MTMGELSTCFSFSVDGREMIFAADSAAGSAEAAGYGFVDCSVFTDGVFIADWLTNSLNDISLTVSSSIFYSNISRDFSVVCDPLAQAGICISLRGQGNAGWNWQQPLDCRLIFSFNPLKMVEKECRKAEKASFCPFERLERYHSANRRWRREVLRL